VEQATCRWGNCPPNGGKFILFRVSAPRDRQFRDQFSLVIGILVGIVAGLLFVALYVANRADSGEHLLEEAEYKRLVAERIAPPARIAVAGRDNAALAVVPSTNVQQVAATQSRPTNGAEVYQQVCVACHGQGIGGAPRADDVAAWRARVTKGKSTLYQHAIGGFQGETGLMPPKGGRIDIPDELIQAAVDHMIDAVPSKPATNPG
jgi:cytochrome c5